MQPVDKKYRSDYTGENVNVIGLYINQAWHYQKEFVANAFDSIPKFDQAVVLGNGISRLQFDINLFLDHRDVAPWGEVSDWKASTISKKFNTYGCNALYRTHRPDFLVASGEQIIDEIANSNYADENIVYANTWVLPEYPQKFNYIPQDPSYNAGAIAAYLAAFDEHKKIFLLGFDGIDSTNTGYNVYSGTPGYPIETDSVTEDFWVSSLATIMETYSDTEFVRVAPTAGFRAPELWKYFPNFRTIDFRQFVIEADL